MDEDDAPTARIIRPKKAINRKTKKRIIFNPEARKEFLTGFRKRKLQRKKKAQEELEEQLKIERKRLKHEAKETFKKIVGAYRPIPSLEDLATEKYDLENHSVSIVELSTSDLAEKNNWIGPNKVCYEEEVSNHSEEEEEEEEVPGMGLKTIRKNVDVCGLDLQSTKNIKLALKKKATQEVKNSRAFQMKNKIEQQKNRKKSFRQKKRKQKLQVKSKRKGGFKGKG